MGDSPVILFLPLVFHLNYGPEGWNVHRDLIEWMNWGKRKKMFSFVLSKILVPMISLGELYGFVPR